MPGPSAAPRSGKGSTPRRRAPTLNSMIAHLNSSEETPRPRLPPDASDLIMPSSLRQPHGDSSSKESALALTPADDDERAVASSSHDIGDGSDGSSPHADGLATTAQRELRLETLQLLVSSRQRTKRRLHHPASGRLTATPLLHSHGRQSAASAPRGATPRRGDEPHTSGGDELPTLARGDEEMPSGRRPTTSSGTSARRRPPGAPQPQKGGSTRIPRPPTSAARAPAATSDAAPAAEELVDGFFSVAVDAASSMRECDVATRIPKDMWLYDHAPISTAETSRTAAANPEQPTAYDGHTGSTVFSRRTFPSAAPNTRHEAVRVARCLDTLLARRVPDQSVLQEGEAFFALPHVVQPAMTRAEALLGKSRANSLSVDESRAIGASDSDATAVACISDDDPYVVAARALVEVADVGLCEVVRHVAPQSMCNGALLDNLRAVLCDVAANCLDYVQAAKVHVDAQRTAAEGLVEQCKALQQKVDDLTSERTALREELEEAQDSANMARERLLLRDEEDARRDLFDSLEEAGDRRLDALNELQDSVTAVVVSSSTGDIPHAESSVGGLTSAPSGHAVPLAAGASDGSTIVDVGSQLGRGAAKQDSGREVSPALSDSASVTFSPTNTVNNNSSISRSRTRRKSMARSAQPGLDDGPVDVALYHALLPFLNALHGTVTATDQACEPFYRRMQLSQPELGIGIATSKWAAVANLVGTYEASTDRQASNVDSAAAAEAELATHVAEARKVAPPHGISISSAVDVLRETAATMKEIQTRLSALAESPELARVGQKELMPPSLPDIPCELCHRIQVVGSAKESKKNVLDSEAVEQITAPLKVDIAYLEKQLSEAEKREEKVKTKLEDVKVRLRNAETERVKEQNAAANATAALEALQSQSVALRGGPGGRQGRAAGGPRGADGALPAVTRVRPDPLSPDRIANANNEGPPGTDRAHSPPLQLNLVINCSCGRAEGESPVARSGGGSAVPSPKGRRKSLSAGSASAPRPGGSAGDRSSKRGLSPRAPVDAAARRTSVATTGGSTSDDARPGSARNPPSAFNSFVRATRSSSVRDAATARKKSPPKNGLSVFASPAMGQRIADSEGTAAAADGAPPPEGTSVPRVSARTRALQPLGGLEPISDDVLETRCDVDDLIYRFPTFATAADPRILFSLGTASKSALSLNLVRSLPWVLKQISGLYRQKLVHDLTSEFQRMKHLAMPTFMFQIALRQKYGEKDLVVDAAAALFVGCQTYFVDARVELFTRFVAEYYSTNTLHSCLKLQRALDDVSVGPQYSLACNDDEMDHRPVSVLVVNRIVAAMLKRMETKDHEKRALERIPETAMFNSDPTSQEDAAAAMARAAITERTRKKWSAEEQEQASRVVPRIVVLSKYCEWLRELEIHGDFLPDDPSVQDGVTPDMSESAASSVSGYQFPVIDATEPTAANFDASSEVAA